MTASTASTGGVGATGTAILPDRPGPVAEFWKGVQQGKLLLQRCRACGHQWHPQADVCEQCRSVDVEWCESPGNGTLYTYTVVHHAVHPVVRPWIPYTLCVVELDEGPRVLATLDPDEGRELAIGSRVKLGFRRIRDDFQIPVFSLDS